MPPVARKPSLFKRASIKYEEDQIEAIRLSLANAERASSDSEDSHASNSETDNIGRVEEFAQPATLDPGKQD